MAMKGRLYIPQNSNIIGASPPDGLMSYPGHSLVAGGLTPLERCSWCILQLQPTGQLEFVLVSMEDVALSQSCVSSKTVVQEVWKLVTKYFKNCTDLSKHLNIITFSYETIYPTPPLGQDMTQGQFLSGV